MAAETRYYKQIGGPSVTKKFALDIQATIALLERNPGLGSPLWGEILEIPGLKSWRLTDFPLNFFYFERADSLDVVRFLGQRQSLEEILSKISPNPEPRGLE